MAAADIGASASNYVGDVALGGGTFGAFKLDTRPFEDLKKYTMLYNKAEYDQRQKDAEAAALELADMTSYDLTSSIQKDAKVLQDKYDKLIAFVRENPDSLDYKNKEAWAKYKTMRNDLQNDLTSAKVRSLMYKAREERIAGERDPEEKRLRQKELDEDVNATDIRTPIKHDQEYADYSIKLPDAPELSFDVMKKDANGTYTRQYSMFNMPRAKANSGVFELGMDDVTNIPGPAGERARLARKRNFWVQGAEVINSSIGAAVNGQGVVDESKLNSTARSLVNITKDFNRYVVQTRGEIESGAYQDKMGKVSFGQGAMNKDDYVEINYKDGISPSELALLAQFSKWNGDKYGTKLQETDDAIQYGQQAVARRGQDLDFQANRERIASNERLAKMQLEGLNPDGNTQTSGNAFDEIGGTQEIPIGGGGKISNGQVLNKEGKPENGTFQIPTNLIPANLISALDVGGVNIKYGREGSGTKSRPVSATMIVKNGQIISLTDATGRPISRQAMENAQKKFDTERKGATPTQWGSRTMTPAAPATQTRPAVETPEQKLKRLFPDK